jgi:cellulose synthase/poly-beta-1,6-N-acetylglucosamine synthase-like glycosyltransferase
MLWSLLTFSSAVVYWVYAGYGQFLQILCGLRRFSPSGRRAEKLSGSTFSDASELPSIAVLITAHNEEHHIRARIQNLISCRYPAERLEIVVASDGSTDQTAAVVRRMQADPEIRVKIQLYETPGAGKTATQNIVLKEIDADVVVFTDADMIFDRDFLWYVGHCMLNSDVGAVAGYLLFGAEGQRPEVSGQGFYWSYELKLRDLETRLGLLAVAAGSCFAVRRSLILPMNPAIGEDCIVPLDVVAQGYQVIQDPRAIAYDTFEFGSQVVLKKRIRMTLRNWQGTWTRPELLNPLRHPGYAFALWSHKLLRWLSPVFLLVATLCATSLFILNPQLMTAAVLSPFVGLFLLAACGWLGPRNGIRIPGTSAAFSFVLANTAFLIGVFRALTGQRVHSYRNTV